MGPRAAIVREATPIKLSFLVPALEVVRAAALETGGGVGSLDSAWRWRGMLHLDCFDPEGNVVQFRSAESPAVEKAT